VAELKAEKERLESVAREKGHADKIRSQISDMNAAIARKEVEYQEAKKLYEALARSNRKFEEGATKFREIFVKVGSLEKERQNYQEELAELRPNVQEVDGTLRISVIVGLSTDSVIVMRHRRATGGPHQKFQCTHC
jgi:DNA repair protein RAD50